MEKNTYTSGSERLKIRPISREALRNFDSMMEKYNQQDIETELKKEQEFLQSIPYSSTSRALLEDLGPIHRIPIEKEPFPRTSTPKTFPRRMENHHERSTNLDRYGYLYDMPSTSKAAGYEPYQRISSPITFPRTREGSRNHVWDEGPSISETLELVPEVDLREELTQIGTKLSEIRQYLDQTTRNLKEKPKFVKKSLARQKRSARSWASSSSGLSSASSNMSIMSPMSSIVESRDVEQGHEGLRNGQKHLDTIFDNRSIASKQENIERYSQEASKSQKSREIEKKHSKSDKKLQQYKSVHDLHRESYSSQEESPLPSSFSQSPPRSRISSRRTQNFLQDLEPLPLPSLPQLEKLDLGLLSPEVKPKMAWKELSLYESETSKRDSAYTSTERSTEKGYNDWTKKGQDNSTKPNQSNSYNQYNHIMPRVKSDRGFLVSSKEPVEQPSPQQQKVHFVTDMTEEQIQDLLKLCNA
uniref:Uncharacterized protein n=1 Tax=Acrobeloides nanus TaxID=290746 RepID=A0A914CRU7_9BILA